MKKLIAELIFGISLFATFSNAAAETIKMLYGNLPPYMYLDEQTQTPRGASITYFEAVATEMGYNVEWVGPLPQARFLQNIKTPDNEVAGAITIVKYAQTEAFLEFPDTPYLQTWPSIAVHHDDPLEKINTMQDLDSYSIGGMAGDALPEPFDQLKIEPIFEEKWVEQNLKKLIARRVDAVFSREAYMLAFHASRLKLDAKIRILSLPVPPTLFYVAFKKGAPQSKELVQQYETAIKNIQISFEELLTQEIAATGSH